jgi:hypothetical protein
MKNRQRALLTLVRSLKGVIYAFDFFGEPVAPINMDGRPIYKTKLGGLSGMTIMALLAWFTIMRFIMMINRENAIVSEVN